MIEPVLRTQGGGEARAYPNWDRSREANELTIADIHAAYAEGSLTCMDLCQAYLQRIEACDKKGPAINSLISLNKNVEKDARALDREYSRRGCVGPLHGVPIVIKDNFNTKDLPTSGGVAALAGMRPATDAVTVARLRNAGAVILAKSNLHELAITGTTVSGLGGQTLNPYDFTRTPGGSSGGTAAAVAANFAVAGVGSDTLNSIRSPASACNLVGIRPTTGLVPRSGVIPLSFAQDSIGPIARTVADACRMLDIMAGPDGGDAATATAKPSWYSGSLVDVGFGRPRIGVLRSYFGEADIHREVNHATLTAIELLRLEGATIIDIVDDRLNVARLIDENSVDVFEFKELFAEYLSEIPGAPIKSLGDLIRKGGLHPSSIEFVMAAEGQSKGMRDPEYASRLAKNRDVASYLTSIFDKHDLDVLVYPLQRRLVVPLTESDQAERNGALSAISGFPAITVPAGFSAPTQSAPIGVPVGLDMLGRPWSEAHLIRIAHAFERASPQRRSPLMM